MPRRAAGKTKPRLALDHAGGGRILERGSALHPWRAYVPTCVSEYASGQPCIRRELSRRIAEREPVMANWIAGPGLHNGNAREQVCGNKKGVASKCANGEVPSGASVGRDSRTRERIWVTREVVKGRFREMRDRCEFREGTSLKQRHVGRIHEASVPCITGDLSQYANLFETRDECIRRSERGLGEVYDILH